MPLESLHMKQSRLGIGSSVVVITLFILASMIMSYAFGEVKFSSNSYDFGILREDDGPVTGNITMVNLGPGPTFIRNVRTTCGCTDASFTEGMIEEGDTAVVSFTYDPDRRPGAFDKHIKVFVGQDNKMHVIRISGRVMASRKTIASYYPDSIGELCLSTLFIDGGELVAGEGKNYFVNLYNPTDHTVRPIVKTSSDALTTAIEPSVIESGATAVLGIYLNSRRDPEPGDHLYEIEICSDADGIFSEIGTVRLKTDLKQNN